MFTTITLFIICLILYIWKRNTNTNYWYRKGVPFEQPLPFFGNALETILLRKSAAELVRDLYFKRTEPFFGIWFLNKPTLFLKCPNLIKQMLVKDFNYFSDRYISGDAECDEFSSNMLFFMKQPKWNFVRRKTRHLFSVSKMKNLFPEIQAISRSLVTFINTSENKNSVNASDVFVKYTTQVAYSTSFGLDSKSFQNKDTPFVSLVKNVFTFDIINIISWISHYYKSSLAKIFKYQMVESTVETFLKEVFSDIEKTRKLENIRREDVMDFLIKLKNESNLETLRKYPVLPEIGRTCIKDYQIPNTAIVIEKGVEVVISLSGLHHDPKYFPEPELFDPERFSNDNVRKRHPYCYMPFGKGPRSCIGERLGLMLVKMGIAQVIKSFEINICNETNVPLQFDPRKFTLSVVGGIYVQFVKLD